MTFQEQQAKITAMYKRCGSERLGDFVTVGFMSNERKQFNKELEERKRRVIRKVYLPF